MRRVPKPASSPNRVHHAYLLPRRGPYEFSSVHRCVGDGTAGARGPRARPERSGPLARRAWRLQLGQHPFCGMCKHNSILAASFVSVFFLPSKAFLGVGITKIENEASPTDSVLTGVSFSVLTGVSFAFRQNAGGPVQAVEYDVSISEQRWSRGRSALSTG